MMGYGVGHAFRLSAADRATLQLLVRRGQTHAASAAAVGCSTKVQRVLRTLGHVTSYVYNFDGTLQSVTDPKSQVYNFGYNALGALVAQKDLANPAIADSVFYDLAGQARRMKTRRGSVVQNTYDVLGRLTYQIGTLGADTAIRQFSYDSVGRRIVGWTSEVRDSILLDPMGRVSNAFTRFGAGPLWRFDYSYNKEDRRTFRALSRDGSGQTFGSSSASYDGFGSLMSLTEGGVNVAFTRTAVSRLPTKQTFTPSAGGGSAWWMGTVFDTLQRMPVRDSFSIAALNQDFKNIVSRDSLERVRFSTGGEGGFGGTRLYRYDRAGRLLNRCFKPFGILDCTNEYGQVSGDAYSYDLAGNRTDANVGTVVVGSGNRTTQFGAATFTFNASGQIATKFDGTSSWTYGWSPLDELRSATASGITVSYTYDAFGRRIRRTYNGTSEYYLHDGDQVAVDLDGTQTIQREYGWRGGVDQLLSVKLADGTAGVAVRDQQLGATVEGLIDAASGSKLADYESTAWGKPNDPSYPAAYKLRYRMGGREYDEATGLYYMRARYYDPQSGRFLSEDPIGIDGGINLYMYAGDDPINGADPYGLDPCVKREPLDPEGPAEPGVALVGGMSVLDDPCLVEVPPNPPPSSPPGVGPIGPALPPGGPGVPGMAGGKGGGPGPVTRLGRRAHRAVLNFLDRHNLSDPACLMASANAGAQGGKDFVGAFTLLVGGAGVASNAATRSWPAATRVRGAAAAAAAAREALVIGLTIESLNAIQAFSDGNWTNIMFGGWSQAVDRAILACSE